MSRYYLDFTVAKGSTGAALPEEPSVETKPVSGQQVSLGARDWEASICKGGQKEPPAKINAGVAWGDVVEREVPRAKIDPVWFTFTNVIADDRAKIEVQGADGAWRTLPTHLSLAEEQTNGVNKYVLQTSIGEATRLGLVPNRACAFRIQAPNGAYSEPTPPIVINDPQNALSRPDHRPMEDRFAGDNRIRNPVFVAHATDVDPESLERIARANVELAGGEVHLTLPPDSLEPGTVIDTHPPVYAEGHGVRSALAYHGGNETRANADGSLSMTFSATDGLVALRARHVSGPPKPAALYVDGKLVPWGDGPFKWLEEKGRFSFTKFSEAVRMEKVGLSDDKSSIVAGAGMVPLGCGAAVVNLTARGVVWNGVRGHRVPVDAEGGFCVDVKDQRFGGLRVNDQIAVVVWPRVHGLDGLVVLFDYDGTKLTQRNPGGSLEGAIKHVGRVEPRNG